MKRISLYALSLIFIASFFSGCKNDNITYIDYENPLVFSSIEEFTAYVQDDCIQLSAKGDSINVSREETFRSFIKENGAENTIFPVVDMAVFEKSMAGELLSVIVDDKSVGFVISIPNDLKKEKDSFRVFYNYSPGGEAALSSFIGMYQADFWDEHPGYYYTDGHSSEDMVDSSEYFIGWIMDDYFYQALIPDNQLDIFWEICNNMMLTYSVKDDKIF